MISAIVVRYLHIADQIKTSIIAGAWKNGDSLEPELTLSKRFGVSRTTIRAALRELEQKHFIRREQGRGTFVAAPMIEKDVGSLVDFHTEAIAAGRVPSTIVLSLVRRACEFHESVVFGERVHHEGVIELQRLRCLDRLPAVWQRSCLPADLLAGLTAKDLEDKSLYRLLADRKNVVVVDVDEVLEPAVASAEAAARLDISVATALFRSQRAARLADGTVVETSVNFVRADLYRFRVTRKAGSVWS
jgi:GntR family transcriptional regulator